MKWVRVVIGGPVQSGSVRVSWSWFGHPQTCVYLDVCLGIAPMYLASRKRCDLKTRKRCDFYSAAQKIASDFSAISSAIFCSDFSAISAAKPAI